MLMCNGCGFPLDEIVYRAIGSCDTCELMTYVLKRERG